MYALLDVHLTGGDPWWYQVVGPALIAVTAIAAAWIAARTANHRQQQQLEEDGRLHAKQLAHDRELQKAQLAYDREQRDRMDVRVVIDDAIKGVDEALRGIAEYVAAVQVDDETREAHRQMLAAEQVGSQQALREMQALKGETDELHQLSQGLYDTSIDLTSSGLRLALRLGSDHKIVKAHDAFGAAISEYHEALKPLHHRAITDEDRGLIEAAEQRAGLAVTAVFSECREWLYGM